MTVCPTCGHGNPDHALVSMGDDAPRPGDISICGRCGAIAVFVSATEIRPATHDETVRYGTNPHVVNAVAAVRSSKTVPEAIAKARELNERLN